LAARVPLERRRSYQPLHPPKKNNKKVKNY
jgi:hypothetical protein